MIEAFGDIGTGQYCPVIDILFKKIPHYFRIVILANITILKHDDLSQTARDKISRY